MTDQKKNVTFEYPWGDNTLFIEADVHPDTPARYPDMNGPGEPPEAGDIEILTCALKSEEGHLSDLDPDGLALAKRGTKNAQLTALFNTTLNRLVSTQQLHDDDTVTAMVLKEAIHLIRQQDAEILKLSTRDYDTLYDELCIRAHEVARDGE